MEKAYALNPPAYRMNGCERTLQEMGRGRYGDEFVLAALAREPFASGRLERIGVTWTNRSENAICIQPLVEVVTSFAANHYVIPCVMYDGNPWGKGREPKGLARDGVNWVFSYERTGIPSCTLSENEEIAFALFASPLEKEMRESSCSLRLNQDGTMAHRILFPVIEEPVTYCNRDTYCAASEGEICLMPGMSFETVVYAWQDRPLWPKYGMAGLEDVFLDVFAANLPPCRTAEEVWRLGIQYAKRLNMPYDGHGLFCIGLLPDEDGAFVAKRIHFEFGWCGQNGMLSRMLIHDYMRTGDGESLNMALSCLDAYANQAVSPSGLIYAHYESRFRGDTARVDTCNLGFVMMEFAKSYCLLRKIGIEKPAYLDAARGVGDFLIDHWSEEYGFGKAWLVHSGTLIDGAGTIGAYIVPGLVEVYRATGEGKYLSAAQRALEFYDKRDLSHFFCTAGALDTNCIDKETSGALVMGGILLYEQTGRQAYLEIARRAAYYFSSWMFYYDVHYEKTSDFAVYGYHTLGGTSVSAQHHHLDPWGGLLIPWFNKLAHYANDPRWDARARMMWANVIQMIADEEHCEVHGLKRPIGAQNEAYLHCRWGWESEEGQCNAPRSGQMNDWLVAWPSAYRLNAIVETMDSSILMS